MSMPLILSEEVTVFSRDVTPVHVRTVMLLISQDKLFLFSLGFSSYPPSHFPLDLNLTVVAEVRQVL